MGKRSKIEELGLEERVLTLAKQNHTIREITDILKRETGEDINYSSVYYFLNREGEVEKRAKHRNEIAKKTMEENINVVKQLKQINEISMKILGEALLSNNHSTAVKVIREILNQLEFQAKLLDKIRPENAVIILNIERVKDRGEDI